MEPCDAASFRQITDEIAASFPMHGYTVAFLQMPQAILDQEPDGPHLADSDKIGNHFVIRITDEAPEALVQFLAIHEYAHCFAWKSRDLHGRKFGDYQRRIYQAYHHEHSCSDTP